ncbi:MAG TPA: hypothetical protein VHG69_13270 [Thermoleophilaceae bacterium]|nr:hypothetical protein [Thermoleophilaceae bacterium]
MPALPPKLDFALLMDTTGSMGGEISSAQSGASSFFDAVRADSPDSTFAVAGFEDFPYSTYGSATGPTPDRPYYRQSDLTAQKATWQTAVNSLATRNGGDIPEAQVPALYTAATGAALTWPTGNVPAGAGISFRDGAARFVALVSDAAFHNDKNGNDPYDFLTWSYAQALGALSSKSIRVIAAESNGGVLGADMSAIAADTNGAYTWLNSDGTGLWTGLGASVNSPGISGALRAARYPVTTATSCAPLEVSLSPGSWADVAGNDALSHTQTITVPAGVSASQLPPDRKVDCSVAYTWGDVAIGERHVEVQVVFPTSFGGGGDAGGVAGVIPSNAFSIARARTSSRGTATLALSVPGPGTLDLLATANASSRAVVARRIRVARVRKAVGAPGTVTVTLRPSRQARRILKRKGQLRTVVRITYTPTGGASSSKIKALTLRLRRARR